MAGTVNKVILIGNLGKDPEIRFLENGTCLARFSIATSETYLDKTSGEKREVTEWHSIVAWKGLATIAQSYLRKGMKVYVEGKLRTRTWQDESNQTKTSTEIVADEINMLSRAEKETSTEKPYPSSIENNNLKKMDVNLSPSPEDDLPF
jgi:single-strand DNA-binding protein